MIKIFRFLAICKISLSVLCVAVVCAVPAWALQKPSQPKVLSNAVVNQPVRFDVSRTLAEMLREAPQVVEWVNTCYAVLDKGSESLISSMALDGADSCTFGYANEYCDTDLRFNWATWLASLLPPKSVPISIRACFPSFCYQASERTV